MSKSKKPDGFAEITIDEILPQPPFRMVIAGPSGCGKTRFLFNTIKAMPKWDNVVIVAPAMSANQEDYLNLIAFYGKEKVLTIVDLPDVKTSEVLMKQLDVGKEADQTTLIIIDDLMEEAKRSKFLSNLATAACHHLGVSSVLLQQSLMLAAIGRTVRLNSDYIVVFSIPMDQRAFAKMAEQMEPVNWRALLAKYAEVTAKKYSPLIIDIKARKLGLPANYYFRDGAWDTGILFPWFAKINLSSSAKSKTLKTKKKNVRAERSDSEEQDESSGSD